LVSVCLKQFELLLLLQSLFGLLQPLPQQGLVFWLCHLFRIVYGLAEVALHQSGARFVHRSLGA
jgi:hypothetical protein